MRLTRTIDVGERKATVKELTVAEIDAWLVAQQFPVKDGDIVGAALFDDFTLDDIVLMSDLTRDALGSMTPSEIRSVKDAACEINADFFQLRGRLRMIGKSLPESPSSSATWKMPR